MRPSRLRFAPRDASPEDVALDASFPCFCAGLISRGLSGERFSSSQKLVVVIDGVRTLRIDVRSRRLRRDGHFRGIREIRSDGAGELESHHTATSSKASRAVGCSAATTQPWWVSSCITRRAVPALRIAAGPLR